MVQEYIHSLQAELEQNANSKFAQEQKAYMRNQFEYYGVKAPMRREIQKQFLIRQYLPEKSQLAEIVKKFWEKPQREFQHFAQELTGKYIKQFDKQDITLLEYMVLEKSWWDTVDFIAVKLMGGYFRRYPEQRDQRVKKWLGSGNLWLQRSSLLFQLKYKQDLDTAFLATTINRLLGSKEFFINKAIGWVLREYSKTNAEWVVEFTNKTVLAPLSKREALRLIS